MGQSVCKCVEAESADGDRSYVYTPLENPPAKSTANARENSPPPAGATDADVGDNRDGGRRKRRFWKKFCRKGRRSAQGERQEQTIHQNTSAQSTADARDPSPRPAADVHEEKDENRDEGKKKKKRRFWNKFCRKGRRSAQGEREEQTIHQTTPAPSTADARDPSAADVHEEEDEESRRGAQNQMEETPDLLTEAGDLLTSHHSSVSDSSDEGFCTVASVDIPWPTVSSGFDAECVDSVHNDVGSVPGLLVDNKEGDVIYNIKSCHYKMGKIIGQGGNGLVFGATRVSDGLKVAVKIVQDVSPDNISIPGHPNPLPREIALHVLATRGDNVPEIIQLLDWEDFDDKYIMVLEHPSPCMDLYDFIESRGGRITESLARSLMKQAARAVIECFKQGVFHMDIKLENFLINTETFDIKLIDFGHGDLLRETLYTSILGTLDYWCPEFQETGEYHAVPSTLWSLGMMLFAMVCWDFPDTNTREQINNKDWKKDFLTKECCSLIHACLQKDPDQRIQLNDFFLHEWFQVR